MQNRWNENDAGLATTDLALRAYTSRLIGSERDLVLHGGGNTSVKSRRVDKLGVEEDIIWVKASGFDLASMGPEGFTALELSKLLKLASLESLSDKDMVNEVLRARLDAGAAAASVEAIVHALIPFKFIDHSHADAILTISNGPDGKECFDEIFGKRVLVLPYVKPGFDLALQFRSVIENTDLSKYEAVILENHGVFTFSDEARQSYEMMIKIVDEAETYLYEKYGTFSSADVEDIDPVAIAQTRKAVGELADVPLLSRKSHNIPADKVGRFGALLRNGTVTPEHVIHNKPYPALLGKDILGGLAAFRAEYTGYFERANDPNLTMLAPFPHWAIFDGGHAAALGRI